MIEALRQKVREAFNGEFMTPVIHGPVKYWEVETRNGPSIVPSFVCDSGELDDLADYCQDAPLSVEQRQGFVCRLSASGFMDCTDWEGHETEESALESMLSQSSRD